MAKVGWMPALCTTAQVGYVHFLRDQLGLSIKDLTTIASQVTGRELDRERLGVSVPELTQSEASQVIDCLKVTVVMKGGKVASREWRDEECTREQLRYIERKLMGPYALNGMEADYYNKRNRILDMFNLSSIDQLTKQQASEAIEWLKK